MRAPCRIEGCEKESRGRGLCSTHWLRWRKHGDPAVVLKGGPRCDPAATCEVGDCDRKPHARGLCTKHYSRWQTHGDPTVVLPLLGRPLKGDVPSWAAVHKRLERQRGSAGRHACINCGDEAQEWSYNRLDPNELRGAVGPCVLAYSLDLTNYDPRCVRCHRVFDLGKCFPGQGEDSLPHPGAVIRVSEVTG